MALSAPARLGRVVAATARTIHFFEYRPSSLGPAGGRTSRLEIRDS